MYSDIPEVRKSALMSLWDGMSFSVMTGLITPYWGLFALRLGGDNAVVAWVTAIPALVTALFQLPAARMVARHPRRLPVLIGYAWVYRLSFLLLAVLPFVPGPRPIIYVVLLSLMNLPNTICSLAWTTLMAEIFPARLRARVFGDRNTLATLTTVAATVAGGAVVATVRFPASMTVLALSSLAAVLVSLNFLRHLEEPPDTHPPGSSPASLTSLVSLVRGDPGFSRFLVGSSLLQIGLNLPAAVFVILFIRLAHLDGYWLGVFSGVSGLGVFLTSRLWGRFESRHSPTVSLALGVAGLALLLPVYAYTRQPLVFALLSALGGLFTAGVNLGYFNGLLAQAPPGRRIDAIALFNLVTGVMTFVAPLVGVWLLGVVGLAPVMWITMAVRALSALLLHASGRVRPRPAA